MRLVYQFFLEHGVHCEIRFAQSVRGLGCQREANATLSRFVYTVADYFDKMIPYSRKLVHSCFTVILSI